MLSVHGHCLYGRAAVTGTAAGAWAVLLGGAVKAVTQALEGRHTRCGQHQMPLCSLSAQAIEEACALNTQPTGATALPAAGLPPPPQAQVPNDPAGRVVPSRANHAPRRVGARAARVQALRAPTVAAAAGQPPSNRC